MRWQRLAGVVAVVVLVGGTWLFAEEKGRDRAERPRRGQDRLKVMAEKLGLSEDQQQKIRGIHEKYEGKVRELRREEFKEVSEVLTAEQREKAKEIFKGRAGGKGRQGKEGRPKGGTEDRSPPDKE